ncbi:MAG: ABC transporter ATP-binding protein [Methanomassiliicoccales archaeon]|nr:ABC transporter ATP-binding protein [Methanomassiliicoccales archaeon]
MVEPIVIEHLSKDFNGFRAVDDLSLVVKRGSFVGFLGPNGAGKSTSIKILTNLLSATNGSASLNGIDVVKRPKEAMAQIGAVVETPEFYSYLTPTETLSYLGELRGMRKEDIRRRSTEVLETVKMTEWKDKRIGKFSKGMKQRIAIAQAILHEPPIVILDEPTSGLDPRGMFEVREILVDLKKQNYTVFMSSHLLNEVQDVCDEVALINYGKLLKSGTVSELISSNNFRRLEVKMRQSVNMELLNNISKMDKISELEPAGDNIVVMMLKGGDDAQIELLKELQGLNLDIISFKESGVALENLYMSLIKESK